MNPRKTADARLRGLIMLSVITQTLSVLPCAGVVGIPTVNVGDPGNTADTRYVSAGYGAVAHTFEIGTYEVTAAQYTEFLNAVAATDTYYLYSGNMWTSSRGCKIERHGEAGSYSYTVALEYANRPVSDISFWDACRFVNWLHNGQPTGLQDSSTTEDGAYTLTSSGMSANSVTRNAGWTWAIPTEDEWYKAAYYKAGSANAGYWDYPTRSDTFPGRDLEDPDGNNANEGAAVFGPIDGDKYTTIVGEFQNSFSPYGTFDQAGNVAEWTETISGSYGRMIRGGDFLSSYSEAEGGSDWWAIGQSYLIGFRVVHVPEPSAGVLVLLACALSGLSRFRRSAP